MRAVLSWAVRVVRLNLGAVLLLAALAGACWMLAARGLAGFRRVLWSLVPLLLAAALVCWLGPGRLFPKVPFEGPKVLVLSENHAVTLLDLPGFLAAGIAIGLGGWLLAERLRASRR